MLLSTTWTTAIVWGLLFLFIFTQSFYFLGNLFADVLLYAGSGNEVDGTRSPARRPTVHVLMPIYREPRRIVESSLEALAGMDYPASLLHVHLVTEADDAVVGDYLDDLRSAFDDRALSLDQIVVDRTLVSSLVPGRIDDFTGEGIPHTKATALKYAFRTAALPPEDVVTVFDADTIVPPDTFDLAIGGLEEYDVVQAKQTVRNYDDGWLPRLEAMGMAAWSHVIYARTTDGPYQLLGKAYFMRVKDLWYLGDWRIDAVTEDLTLGIDAYRAGYSLGVLDRYVQDLCPSDYADWVTQKRRWVAGPYPYLVSHDFDAAELVRFWVYGVVNQVVSVLNVVGVPSGALYLALYLLGVGVYTSPLLVVITTFNLANWVYYSLRTYQATASGVEFASTADALKFYLLSNPLTQLGYTLLWVHPISLAVCDFVRRTPPEFQVTTKYLWD